MEFDYMNIVWAVLPAIVGVIAGMYVSWKAKVAADGVNDWRDAVVGAIDEFVEDLSKDKKEGE